MYDITAGEAARLDGLSAGLRALFVGEGGNIQPKVGLLLLRIGAMAGETFIGQDAFHIAVEVDVIGQGRVMFLHIRGQFEAAAGVEDEDKGDEERTPGKQSVTHGRVPVS